MRQRGEPPLDEAIDDEAVDGDTPGEVVLRTEDATGDDTPGAIRIGVGHLINRVEDPKPWPLRRVRLTVEDSGCGMTQEQLDRIVCGDRAPSRGSHGIGFRVVRELVGASNGDLRVMSAPSVGTRVQIEWPVTKIADEFVLQTGAETSCMEDSSRLAAASFRPERERRAANDSKSTHRTKMNAIPVSQMDSAVGVDRGMAC
jgi:hypothetical protein